MGRIKEHGALVDVLADGGVIIQPRSGSGSTNRGKFNAGVDAGSNDTYVISLVPPLTSYITGQSLWFKANTANTGAATLNVNGLGAKTIVKVAGGVATALATNDIRAGQWVHVIYDGTNMQMISMSGNAPDVAASILATTIDNGDTTHAPDGNSVFDALATKAPIASPEFTGTVAGITKGMVGLGSADNTSDASKPVSTAQQTALDLKANLESPTFTGTVGGVTSAMVGLGNVDNTSDANKPVSTAQQTALDLKVTGPATAVDDAFAQFDGTTGELVKSGVTLDTDVALAGNSDIRLASQKAVKAYADTKQTAGDDLTGSATNDSAAAGEVGELLTASLASGSATSLVTATPKTLISLSLTAGDWDVWGVADYIPDGTTTTAVVQQGISQTDNTLGGQDTFTSSSGGNLSGTVLGSLIAENAPHQRISLGAPTTVYLIGKASFAISTMTAYGSIFARRRR